MATGLGRARQSMTPKPHSSSSLGTSRRGRRHRAPIIGWGLPVRPVRLVCGRWCSRWCGWQADAGSTRRPCAGLSARGRAHAADPTPGPPHPQRPGARVAGQSLLALSLPSAIRRASAARWWARLMTGLRAHTERGWPGQSRRAEGVRGERSLGSAARDSPGLVPRAGPARERSARPRPHRRRGQRLAEVAPHHLGAGGTEAAPAGGERIHHPQATAPFGQVVVVARPAQVAPPSGRPPLRVGRRLGRSAAVAEPGQGGTTAVADDDPGALGAIAGRRPGLVPPAGPCMTALPNNSLTTRAASWGSTGQDERR